MSSAIRHWVRAAILAGFAYLVIGRVFAWPTDNVKVWRLAAWGVSGVVFATHIGLRALQMAPLASFHSTPHRCRCRNRRVRSCSRRRTQLVGCNINHPALVAARIRSVAGAHCLAGVCRRACGRGTPRANFTEHLSALTTRQAMRWRATVGASHGIGCRRPWGAGSR